MSYMVTIRNLIQEANPKEYAQMQASGELDQVLQDYQEQIVHARTQAARRARAGADQSEPNQPMAAMNMAALSAQEIQLAQIKEEILNLYGQATE